MALFADVANRVGMNKLNMARTDTQPQLDPADRAMFNSAAVQQSRAASRNIISQSAGTAGPSGGMIVNGRFVPNTYTPLAKIQGALALAGQDFINSLNPVARAYLNTVSVERVQNLRVRGENVTGAAAWNRGDPYIRLNQGTYNQGTVQHELLHIWDRYQASQQWPLGQSQNQTLGTIFNPEMWKQKIRQNRHYGPLSLGVASALPSGQAYDAALRQLSVQERYGSARLFSESEYFPMFYRMNNNSPYWMAQSPDWTPELQAIYGTLFKASAFTTPPNTDWSPLSIDELLKQQTGK